MEYKVQICCGTMCYIMGGAELHSLKENLPADLQNNVTIEGISCLGKCDEPNAEKHHPCAIVNGITISQASINKIIELLQSL